jgi:hypothetical protein
LVDPGANSAAIAQLTTTPGLGTYTLGMPIRDKLPFSTVYIDGITVKYHVTDTSGTSEEVEGVYSLSDNTLTRDTLLLSSTGSFIDWPASGQRVVTPLIPPLPICDIPPTIGQLLAWDGTEWCPITRTVNAVVCATLPLDGQVLIWSATENAYCPVDFCTLVAACL